MEAVGEIEKSSALDRARALLRKAFPYICILIASVVALYVWLFYEYIVGGDDVAVHRAMVGDILYGFENGFFSSTGHLIFGNFAYNPYMFYGHLPHFLAAGFAYLFSWMGAGAIDGIKFVALVSFFFSGVYMYLLAKKITKSQGVAIGFAIFYVFMPYRLFCLYYRFAYSEAIAQGFIPIFFYGLYSMLHDEKAKASSYIAIVIGAAGLLLCHPFTALITCLAAVIFLLANILRVINLFKDWKKIVYAGVSVVLILLITAGWLVPMLKGETSGYYRLSDEDAMWTTVEDLIYRLYQTDQFSGIINFSWLETYGSGTAPDTQFLWALGLALYPALCIAAYLVDWALEKKMEEGLLAYITRALVAIAIMIVPLAICQQRIEMYLAALVYLVAFLYFRLVRNSDPAYQLPSRPAKEMAESVFLNPDLYAFGALIVLTFLFLYCDFMWEDAPSFLRMGQFPFRFWGLSMFCTMFFLMVAIKPFAKYKGATIAALAIGTFAFVLSAGPIDKRIYAIEGNRSQYYDPDMSYYESYRSWGTANEYLPQVFYDYYYGEVEAEYPDGLIDEAVYYIIQKKGDLPFGLEDYITPVFVEGSGEVTVTFVNTPEVTFEITAYEDSLLQIPQIYYDGYECVATYEDGTAVECEVREADGLVAAYIPEGTYTLSFTYPGPVVSQIMTPISIIAILALPCWAIGEKIIEKKGRKKAPLAS